MRMLNDFPIRLTIGFVLIVALLGGTALFALRQVTRSSTQREALTRDYVENVALAERLHGEEERTVAVGRGYLITGAPEFLERLDEAEAAFGRTLKELADRALTPEGVALLRNVGSAYVDYQAAERALIAVRRDNASVDDMVAQFERQVMPKRERLSEAIEAFVAHKRERMEAGSSDMRSAASRATRLAASSVVLAIALCSTLAWIFGRQFARASRREREALRVAERAVAARQELLGIVAHDLRNPLAAIGMQAAILRKTSTEDRARKNVEAIGNIVMRMEHVIRSLLDTASIETGKFSVNPAPCGVSEVLQEAVEMLGTLASTKSIRLELNIPDSDLWMLADRDRVFQVLTNLVENAVKFTPVGGRVEVAARRTGEAVRFSIADTGPGIEPEHLPHIFERFWKAEKGGKQGTGLGLYIAKGIVDAHGGSIWVESAPGKGTTFFFALPYAEAVQTSGLGHEEYPTTHA